MADDPWPYDTPEPSMRLRKRGPRPMSEWRLVRLARAWWFWPAVLAFIVLAEIVGWAAVGEVALIVVLIPVAIVSALLLLFLLALFSGWI